MNFKLIKNLEKLGKINYNNENGKVQITPEKLGAVIYWINECDYEVTGVELINVEADEDDYHYNNIISFARRN